MGNDSIVFVSVSIVCSSNVHLAWLTLLCVLTGTPVKVTGGDCQEMLKLLPLGANLADPGIVTGGVACETGSRKLYDRVTVRSLALTTKAGLQEQTRLPALHTLTGRDETLSESGQKDAFHIYT